VLDFQRDIIHFIWSCKATVAFIQSSTLKLELRFWRLEGSFGVEVEDPCVVACGSLYCYSLPDLEACCLSIVILDNFGGLLFSFLHRKLVASYVDIQ